jgi:hypothetical protein
VAQGRARRSGQHRVKVPGISELLRPASVSPVGADQLSASLRQASGRESHSSKITVYLSSAELLDLEQAKLTLRGYGISADRGRIVREALAVLLADLDADGEDSLMVRRLREGR